MKGILIFFSAICAICAYDLKCPVYKCSTTSVKEGEVCGVETHGNLDIKKCEKGFGCLNIEFENPSVCVKQIVANNSILPGDPCTKSQECATNECIKKSDKVWVCTGIALGAKCSSTSQCDRGLYCKEGKCKKTGEGCDGKGIGCSANQVCDRAEGKCHIIGSVPVGQSAPVPAACQTYYQDGSGKCSKAPGLRDLKSNSCPSNGQCDYFIDNANVKTPCVCLRDGSGKKHCPPGKGNFDMEAVSRA